MRGKTKRVEKKDDVDVDTLGVAWQLRWCRRRCRATKGPLNIYIGIAWQLHQHRFAFASMQMSSDTLHLRRR